MNYIRIYGKQYDISELKHVHPGGSELLELCSGEPDSTALFESYHAFCNENKVNAMMKKYEVVNEKPSKQMFQFKTNGFYLTLKARVRKFFEAKFNKDMERGMVKWNLNWFITVVLVWILFLVCQYQMLFGEGHWFTRSIFSLLSGISLTGLGYNVLHDASHYAVSKNPVVNQYLSQFHSALQCWNHILWAKHHCVRHHQYTGNVEYDPDMHHAMPFLRKSTQQSVKPLTFTLNLFWMKLLFVFIVFPGALFGQGLVYHLKWMRTNHLWKMTLPINFTITKQLGQLITSALFLIMMVVFGGRYAILHMIGGNLAFFIGSAPDHDLFPTHLEVQKFGAEMDWGETQVRAAANFCSKSRLFTKFMGGINYQIEHHLFPSMSNHYLQKISPIVQQTCKEFNIPYNCIDDPIEVGKQLYKTYYSVASHGKGK